MIVKRHAKDGQFSAKIWALVNLFKFLSRELTNRLDHSLTRLKPQEEMIAPFLGNSCDFSSFSCIIFEGCYWAVAKRTITDRCSSYPA